MKRITCIILLLIFVFFIDNVLFKNQKVVNKKLTNLSSRIIRDHIVFDVYLEDGITEAILYYREWIKIKQTNPDITLEEIKDTILDAYVIYESTGNIGFFIKGNLCVKVEGSESRVVKVIDFDKSITLEQFLETHKKQEIDIVIKFFYPENLRDSDRYIWTDMVIYLSLYEIFEDVAFGVISESNVKNWLNREKSPLENKLIEDIVAGKYIFSNCHAMRNYIFYFLKFHNSNERIANIDQTDLLELIFLSLISPSKVSSLVDLFYQKIHT